MTSNREPYPSDLSDHHWEQLIDVVPPVKKGGRPAEYSRRELVNAILYIHCKQIPWRRLPEGFPPWNTVFVYFNRWKKSGDWNNILTKLIELKDGIICE